MQTTRKKAVDIAIFGSLAIAATVFLIPIAIVVLNSFKSGLYISGAPFALPVREMFVGFENYARGLSSAGFFGAILRSVFVTVSSVALILVCCSMTAWYLLRVQTRWSRLLYLLLVFSMIVPFQMVMYTMTFTVDRMGLSNLPGIVAVYLGFGAGLSVFMMRGALKSVPREIEEAASIDGCSPIGTFFLVIFPIMRPTLITVALLNTMWIWNDYLLPYLVLGTDEKTIPVAIQLAMQGAYGATDYGGLMAMLVLAIIPVILFYSFSQKYIIKGVIAGAVKG